MPELQLISITQEQFDKIIIPVNHVLCEQFYESEGMTTKSGIVIGVLTELTYQDSDNPNDDSSHVADFSENAMLVAKVPERLFYQKDNSFSMPWETEMELMVGDVVWTNAIDSLNAVAVKCEGKVYKIIPYQDLYVAKRDNVVIPLNGYCLLRQIKKQSISVFDVTSTEKYEQSFGQVAYVGSCNKSYKDDRSVDFVDLYPKDVVVYDRKATPFALERTAYNNKFSDTGEIFMVLQRRYIAMVIKRAHV